MNARIVVFYLPQFHPIPENDRWWGKGYTEWRAVSEARPLFWGHEQPRLPADLGFYDLRLPEVRAAQAELASQHGVEGFCYWHYWLGNGDRLLERPFNAVLESGEPDFPFCLAWANHDWRNGSWYARASGKDRILAKQTYPGEQDARDHFRYLLKAFTDKRYISVDDKPLFLIHAPGHVPEPRRLTDLWRTLAYEAGLPGLHLVGTDVKSDQLEAWGLDATHPSFKKSVLRRYLSKHRLLHLRKSIVRRVLGRPLCLRYDKVHAHLNPRRPLPSHEYPIVVPNWDNTPRAGKQGVVLQGATPERFREHLRDVLNLVTDRPLERRIVFAKSWNEWAEGNYLEPDREYGKAFLEVIRDEVKQSE